MARMLDAQKIEIVFQSRPDIIEGIKTTADSPRRIALFNEIAGHVYDQLRLNGEEPAQKKRKLATEQQSNGGPGVEASASNAALEPVSLEIKDISVSVPQRKKFELCFTPNFLYARAPGTTAPIPSICYAWRDIEYAFYLPVPDKAQVQHNYVLFPKGTYLPSKSNAPMVIEPLVFTVPTTAPKQGTVGGAEAAAAAAVSDTYKGLFHWALSRHFRSVGSTVDIVSANPSKFQSAVRQPHRPNEKAVHVSGFRGSKDGFLFFLDNGILWGFKKPLVFVPLTRIAAVSYTNILQITFNMVMEIFSGEDGTTTEELEFGMLDQQDYGAIENYVRSNRLQDRSMAEQRKAKLQLAENRGPKKQSDEPVNNGDAGVDNGNADGLTELERARLEAEQQLQDEDDEEDDEDFDPGSDGESGGSGSSSEEEDDNREGGYDEGEEVDEELDEEVEGEEEGEEEEEEEEPEEEKEVKKEPISTPAHVASPQKVLKKETPSMPVRTGWASLNQYTRHDEDDIDMEEKFDVVG